MTFRPDYVIDALGVLLPPCRLGARTIAGLLLMIYGCLWYGNSSDRLVHLGGSSVGIKAGTAAIE